MNRLLEVGFESAGRWVIENEELKPELTRHAARKNILYAFVCDGAVMYVGKTVQTLASRMSGYKSPGETQSTNINNNRRLIESLASGSAVEILALPDNGLLHYGIFHLNLAAALEDDIIRRLDPPWNGGMPEKPSDSDAAADLALSDAPDAFNEAFRFVLQKTYFNRGFFNVGVASQHYIGADAETIELFLGDAERPVLGTINRSANTNGTPRVMGGPAVRDWFQANAQEMAEIAVQVLSPTSIRLKLVREPVGGA